ncbi:tol-pal system-associated acyl-CoA thioesterase [Marichromatium bheemlicum]|uniref:Tol-pal system-associated acyl-CoA thioesterase n=1 Tax=Marichromatium bheemlicum TaxID=365339 RepID=A0ABX1IAI5_9GAMM|nr:tol-pal system-associated acyl-CoA thioesterase [Marichromatium bheemlicum]
MSTSSQPAQPGFIWPIRVYYEDTDAAGVVFYANYLRFFERARTEWLRALGYEQDELRAREGVLFVVRRVDIEYLAPARFNDRLNVHTRLTRIGGASMTFAQDLLREADGELCCRSTVKVGCIDAAPEAMQPTRIPAGLLADIRRSVAE